MAVTKTLMKLTERDAVVKVAGSAGSTTVQLTTELKCDNEFIDGTPRVSICGVQWTGSTDSAITIVRNGVKIMTLNCGASGALEMNGQMMIPDDIEADANITVNITGDAAELWMRLRKISGYTSGYEAAVYGQYDDPARLGASTTMQGSPDYTVP